MPPALVWFRRDLRLSDHPALHHALSRGYQPLPVYIHDEAAEIPGSASAWWLHHSLDSLQKDLSSLGSDLLFLKGDSRTMLLKAVKDSGARAVFWNRRYAPRDIELDTDIDAALRDRGIEVESFGAALLQDPGDFGKADRSPYRVFTPFWKAMQKKGPPRTPLPPPTGLPGVEPKRVRSMSLRALDLLPGNSWYRKLENHWQPGERAAWSGLHAFLEDGILDYSEARDLPAQQGTSRLSPHFHFGEITPAQVWHAAQSWSAGTSGQATIAAVEAFQRQVAWREFAHHLLYHFPDTAEQALDPRYRAFPWASDYDMDLARWQQGTTGIPIVDAGMRELWATGWMHNRVRMICASLLTKNLLIPWQQGAHWFGQTLVDADLANNTFGWQWSAGCGADAAPYFRIFNPVTQGERFDADGSYVRRWVPELAQLPAKWIHKPWQAPQNIRADAGLITAQTYPDPLVDLKQSRARALAAWDRVKRLPR